MTLHSILKKLYSVNPGMNYAKPWDAGGYYIGCGLRDINGVTVTKDSGYPKSILDRALVRHVNAITTITDNLPYKVQPFAHNVLGMQLMIHVIGVSRALVESSFIYHFTGNCNNNNIFPGSFYNYCYTPDNRISVPLSKVCRLASFIYLDDGFSDVDLNQLYETF